MPVFFAITIVALVIYFYQYWQSKKRFVASIHTQLYSAACLAQDQTSIALALGDSPQVRTILQSFINHGEFVYSAVFDADEHLYVSCIKPLEGLTESRQKRAERPASYSSKWKNGETHIYTTLDDGNRSESGNRPFHPFSIVEINVPLFVLKESESNGTFNELPDPEPIRVSSQNGVLVGTLRIGLSTFNELEARSKSNDQVVKLILFSAITAFLLVSFLIKRTVSRIQEIARCADNVVAGQLDERVTITGVDEVSELGRSFNSMMERLDSARILEKCLQRSQKLASIGNIAAGVAHEFNNVLQIISTHTELALLDVNDTDAVQENLDIILDSSGRASRIVASLLAFSRKKKLHRSLVDLSDLSSSMIDLMLPQFRASNVIVVKDLQKVPRVLVDEGQFQQVLMNMFTNALHAMTPSGGRMTVKTEFIPCLLCQQLSDGGRIGTIKSLDSGNTHSSDDTLNASGKHVASGSGMIQISITDTGRGISTKDKDRIFDPFYSTKGVYGDTPEQKSIDGTGIGLAVCFGVVTNHKGEIQVKSTVGKGTTFTITIPSFPSSEELTSPKLSIFDSPAFAFNPERPLNLEPENECVKVLVVDDEKNICSRIASYFIKHGVTTRFASSAEEAIDMIEEGGFYPDLVISDILMPGISGLELLRYIKTHFPEILVMLLTGNYTDEIAMIAHEAGAICCDKKPIKLEELFHKAKSYIDESKEQSSGDKKGNIESTPV